MNTNKKGQLGGLQSFVVGVGGVAIVLVIALIVVGQLQIVADQPDKYCSATYTYNASANNCYLTTNDSVTTAITRTTEYTAAGTMAAKLGTIPTWVGIVIVVALAFLVLGFFYGREKNIF